MPKKTVDRRNATSAEMQRSVTAIAEVKAVEKELREEAKEILAASRAGRQVLAELRAARERQGLSLADLAQRTGMTRSAISKLENDKEPNPTLHTLHRLATAIGVRVDVTVR